MERKLMKGNEAVGEAAIAAGCRYFFGYPITPQNELPEYMARRLPEVGGTYLQAESEVSAINMVYGAAGAGARVMTSSSSPGISLKQEGLSYLAGAELPCVVVNMMRGGPGLGGIQPAQSDYFQATKGGGHGDYHLLVLAPAYVQELVDLVQEAFDLADKYRNPVMILGDGVLGQMMEPVAITKYIDPRDLPKKEWATTGASGRRPNLINSLYIDPVELAAHNRKLAAKYQRMCREEQRFQEYCLEDAETILVAYGVMARICRSVVDMARHSGLKWGLFRPISLYPFPGDALYDRAKEVGVRRVVTAELSCGQLIEDVRLALDGLVPTELLAYPGGLVPSPAEVFRQAKSERGALNGCSA